MRGETNWESVMLDARSNKNIVLLVRKLAETGQFEDEDDVVNTVL